MESTNENVKSTVTMELTRMELFHLHSAITCKSATCMQRQSTAFTEEEFNILNNEIIGLADLSNKIAKAMRDLEENSDAAA